MGSSAHTSNPILPHLSNLPLYLKFYLFPRWRVEEPRTYSKKEEEKEAEKILKNNFKNNLKINSKTNSKLKLS